MTNTSRHCVICGIALTGPRPHNACICSDACRREVHRREKREQYAADRVSILNRNRQFRAANKEKINAERRARYAANPERRLAQMRKWRAANLDAVLTRQRQRNAANREAVNEQRRLYLAANREKINAKRRARYAANPQKRLVQLKWNTANRERINAVMRERRAANREKINEQKRQRLAEMDAALIALLGTKKGAASSKAARSRESQLRQYYADRERHLEKNRRWRAANREAYNARAREARLTRSAAYVVLRELETTPPGELL